MKKRYTKPELRKVELVPDQAVLGACKTTALAPGPVGGADCREGTGNQCMTISS